MSLRKKLVDILLEEKLINEMQVKEIAEEQRVTGFSFHKILVSKKIITQLALAQALAKQLDIQYIQLDQIKIEPQIIAMLPQAVVRKHKVIPIRMEGNELYVAFADPLNLPALDEIKLYTGCQIKQMITTEEEIDKAIEKYYKVEETLRQSLIDLRVEKLKERKTKDQLIAKEQQIGRLEDIPVVRLVTDLINSAINARASDIHLEPQHPEMVLRYRIDGILHDIMTIPKHIESSAVSRVKVLANMDITERRRPQDGHITVTKDGKDFDIRVSTVLTVNGEKIVMRILERSSMLLSLEQLGLTLSDKGTFESLIAKPYGMILVTGPTGSGKTTTLYAVLSQLDAKKANIITIEEPVEYKLNRINQIQVDPTAKLNFATGLRTILRQDPDIIMVGEIRDVETAEIAIQAALTGHLVFSTLHTNDAVSAITRLIDMGIEPFLISSTVIGTIAQRLCRTICPNCRIEYDADSQEYEFIQKISGQAVGNLRLVKGKGCDSCFQTGYRGRTGIFEVLKVSDTIRRMIAENKPEMDIKNIAKQEGMKTLQENGIEKVLNKISTLEEIKRVVFM